MSLSDRQRQALRIASQGLDEPSEARSARALLEMSLNEYWACLIGCSTDPEAQAFPLAMQKINERIEREQQRGVSQPLL